MPRQVQLKEKQLVRTYKISFEEGLVSSHELVSSEEQLGTRQYNEAKRADS